MVTAFADKSGGASSAHKRNKERDRMQTFVAQCLDDIKDSWKQCGIVFITPWMAEVFRPDHALAELMVASVLTVLCCNMKYTNQHNILCPNLICLYKL